MSPDCCPIHEDPERVILNNVISIIKDDPENYTNELNDFFYKQGISNQWNQIKIERNAIFAILIEDLIPTFSSLLKRAETDYGFYSEFTSEEKK